MRKFLLILFLSLISFYLFGQTEPVMDELGIKRNSGTGDIQPGETVDVQAYYDGSLPTGYSYVGVYYDDEWSGAESEDQNQISVGYYNSSDAYLGEQIVSINSGDVTESSGTITFSFTIPTHTSTFDNASYIDVYFGNYATKPRNPEQYGDEDASSTIGSQPTGYSATLNYSYDDSTDPPTANSWTENSSTEINVDYTLPEAGTDNSVWLYWDTSGDTTSYAARVKLTGNDTEATHDFNLTYPFTTSDSDVRAATGSLSDGTAYYLVVSYDDEAGNGRVTDASSSTTSWDGATVDFTTETLTVADGTGDDVNITYELPEDASDVWINFWYSTRAAKEARIQIANSGDNYTGGADRSITLDGSSLGGSADASDWDTNYNNSLSNGTQYWIVVEYQDQYGNSTQESGTSSTFTYSYDSSTQTPTMDSASQKTSVTSPVLTFQYDLPEDGQNRTVELLIDASGDADGDGDHCIVTLEGNNGQGNDKTVELDYDTTSGFTTSDSDVYDVTGTSTLTDGNTYYFYIRYQDSEGNAAATSSEVVSLAWDGSTDSPTLNEPDDNDSDNSSVAFNVTIPETANTSTYQLYLTDNNNSESTTLTLQSITTNTNFYITGGDLNDTEGTDNVSGISGDFSSLTDGHSYEVQFGYQDQYGNDEATTGSNTLIYDVSAAQISISSPASSSTQGGDFDIVYTKSEVANSGTFTIKFDNTNDSYDCTLTMNDTYCDYTNEQTITIDVSDLSNSTGVSSQSGDNTLNNGETYDILLDYNDELGNSATTKTVSDITYTTDNTTDNPTANSWTENSNAEIAVDYDLSETGLTNSVWLYWNTTADTSGYTSRVKITGEDASGNHNFNLTYPFTTGDSKVREVYGSSDLSHGTDYYLVVSYKDEANNDRAIDATASTVTWDEQTDNGVSLTNPSADSYHNGSFDVTYALPETGTDGTIKLIFYDDSGLTTKRSELTLVTGSSLHNTSSHTISLNPADLSAAAEVDSWSENNNLIDDNDSPEDYYFVVEYQDQYGNDAVESSGNIRFYYDDTAQPISTDPTFSDLSTDDDVQVTYTLPEDASAVDVYFYDTSRLREILGMKTRDKKLFYRKLSRLSREAKSRALRSQLTIDDASTYYDGSTANTLTLDASDFINDNEVTSYNGTNNSLVEDTSYHVEIGYFDLANNGEITSNPSGTDTYTQDSATESPTANSWTENSNIQIAVDYNLAEAGETNSVWLYWNTTADTSGYASHVKLNGEDTSGSHSFNLTYPFTTDDAVVREVATGASALVDGANYYLIVSYKDEAGNTRAIDATASTVSWDESTDAFESNDFVDPCDGCSDNSTIDIEFTLDEAASSGNVYLYLDDDADHGSIDKDIQLISTYESAATHSFVLDGSNISGDSDVNGVTDNTADIGNSLSDGTSYYMAVGYKDQYNNSEEVSAWHQFTYDTTVNQPSVESVTDQVGSTIDVTFNIDEAPISDTITVYIKDSARRISSDFDSQARNSRATVSLLRIGNVTSTGSQTVTLTGDGLATDDSPYTVSVISGATSLTSGNTYHYSCRFTDEAGNQSIESASVSSEYDAGTETPTSVSASEEANSSEGPVLDVNYTLPEAGQNVQVLIDDNDSHGSYITTIDISGNDTAASHNFNLSVPFAEADDGGDGDDVSAVSGTTTLTDGTYYMAVKYQDDQGNTAVTSSWDAFSWDATTSAVTWQGTQPSTDNRAFSILYNLSEAGASGEVVVEIDNDADHGSIWADLEITDNNSSGNNSFVVDGDDLTDASAYSDGTDDVSNTPSETAFTHNSTYYLRVGYKDTYYNDINYSSWTTVTYDEQTQAPTLDLPNTNFGQTFDIQYDLPEDASDGTLYISFAGQGGGDTGTHKFIISDESSGTDITISDVDATAIDDHASLTYDSGSHGLTNGASYDIKIGYQDIVGNAEATDTQTGLTYNQTTVTLNIESSNVGEDPLEIGSDDQLIFGFKLYTSTGTCSFDGITFSRAGTAAQTEFQDNDGGDGTNCFHLWESDDASFGGDTEIWNAADYGTSITFSDATGTDAATIDATGKYYFVTVDVATAGNGANESHTIGVTIDGSTDITSDDDAADAISGSFAITQVNHYLDGYVTVTDQSYDGGNLSLNTDNQAIYQVTIAANQGSTTLTQLDFDLSNGTWDANDVKDSGLQLYQNSSDDFGTASTLGSAASYPASSPYEVSFSGLTQTINTDNTYIWLTVDLDSPTAGADQTHTVQAEINADSDVVTGYSNTNGSFPMTGVSHDITDATLSVANQSIGDIPLDGQGDNQAILGFYLSTDTGEASFEGVDFSVTGTADSDNDITSGTAFQLYESTDASFAAGSDTPIWTGAALSGTVSLSGSGRSIDSSGSYYFLTVDVAGGFDMTHDIEAQIADGNITTASASVSGLPISDYSHYLDGYVNISGGDYGGGLNPGDSNQAFFTFQMDANQGNTAFSVIDIALSGAADGTDFETDGFQLFASSTDDFSTASAIGSGLDYATTLNFSGLSQDLTTSTTYYWLTADVASGANTSNTIKAEIAASTDVTTGYDLYEGTFPISGTEHTLPVEMQYLDFTNEQRTVFVKWLTWSETDNYGFYVHRGLTPSALENEQTIQLNSTIIPGQGTSSDTTNYEFEDGYRVNYGVTYYYWIESVDYGGISDYIGPHSYRPLNNDGSSDTPTVPSVGLRQNYPNPFNPRTTIEFVAPESKNTTVNIYNLKGQLVKKIFDGFAEKEKVYRVIWNGDDEYGKSVSSGIYFYRMKCGKFEENKQMLIIK